MSENSNNKYQFKPVKEILVQIDLDENSKDVVHFVEFFDKNAIKFNHKLAKKRRRFLKRESKRGKKIFAKLMSFNDMKFINVCFSRGEERRQFFESYKREMRKLNNKISDAYFNISERYREKRNKFIDKIQEKKRILRKKRIFLERYFIMGKSYQKRLQGYKERRFTARQRKENIWLINKINKGQRN